MIFNISFLTKLNKKADTRLSLMVLVELVLLVMLLIFVYFSVTDNLEKKDFLSGEYAVYYGYYTTLTQVSPGDALIISNENRDYHLTYMKGKDNYVGVKPNTNKANIYQIYPFILSNKNSEFKDSDLNNNVYFLKSGDVVKIANIGK